MDKPHFPTQHFSRLVFGLALLMLMPIVMRAHGLQWMKSRMFPLPCNLAWERNIQVIQAIRDLFCIPNRWRSRITFEFRSRFYSPSQKGHQHTELPGWFCLCQKKDFWSSWIRLFGDFLYFLPWDSSPLNHRLRNMFFTYLKQIQEFLKCQRRDGLWPFITEGPWVSVSGALFVTSICCWWFRNPENSPVEVGSLSTII